MRDIFYDQHHGARCCTVPPKHPQLADASTATTTMSGRAQVAVRQRQWELHCRAAWSTLRRIHDHRFLRRDDLLARCRQPLKLDYARPQHGMSQLRLACSMVRAPCSSPTRQPPNVTSYDVFLTTAGDVLIATGVPTARPCPASRVSSSPMWTSRSWGAGKYAEATGTMTFDGVSHTGTVPQNADLIYKGTVCGPNVKGDD